MEHADAKSVRGNWQDSIGSFFDQFRHTSQQPSTLSALHGHLEEIPRPYLIRFFTSERVLRNAIPILIALLLIIVAAARITTLMDEEVRINETTKTEMAYIGEIIASRLSNDTSLEAAINTQPLSHVLLENAIPKAAIQNGRRIFLFNDKGKVVTSLPFSKSMQGLHLARLTGRDLLIASFGAKAGTRQITLDGKEMALALYRTITGADRKQIGSILITQTESALFAPWYQRVNMNITLFLALSTVLVVFLYAYFAQGTKAREADQLFLETNARFDTALSRGHCGLWDWDLSRGRVVWSSSMYQMLGMETSERVMGYGELTALLHPDDADFTTLANSAFEANEKSVDHRFRMLHSSGSWVWLRMRAELVYTKNSIPHLIGIAVDITEQELLKQHTRNADIRLRDAIENISEAFVLWDSKRRLVMCNSKYQQLYNLPASAVVSGNSHDKIMAQSSKPRIRKQISTEKKVAGGAQTFEAQLEDGRWLLISERRTQDGGFVSIGTDITQMKRNEEKLITSERRLIATVSDQRKTQQKMELHKQQLVELADKLNDEKNRAEDGSRAKSEFLANISHELRTPLNAIIGFSEIMQSKMFGPLGSEKYEEYACDIHNSGNFLLGVINDVLDMSKIEAGRFQLNPETVKLDELLGETLRIIKIQAEEAGLTVKHNIPDNLSLQADRRAVKQILLNLLSNAVKFTPENGEISVSTRHSKTSVNIIIQDNGIGISKEAIKRLGQPFEQVQDQFSKNHKGSGLGLAIAKSLAGLHGGSLKIASVEGEGTTVTVRLPFKCKPRATNTEDQQKAA